MFVEFLGCVVDMLDFGGNSKVYFIELFDFFY